MAALAHVLMLLAAYLLGSIPTGYLVARARGLDIRTAGSGNIGATNVFRVLGKPAGVLVLGADALKGAVACWLIPRLCLGWLGEGAPASEWPAILAGVASILGHNYPCWLRFKGGKGIATTAGVLLALIPKALGVALAVWLVVFLATRYVSVASLTAALTLPLIVGATGGSNRLVIIVIGLSALAVFKHKSNIQRLLAGTEHRFGAKQPAGSDATRP